MTLHVKQLSIAIYTWQMGGELQRLQQKNESFKQSLNQKTLEMSLFADGDEKVKYYTGLQNYAVLIALNNYVEANIPQHHNSTISK